MKTCLQIVFAILSGILVCLSFPTLIAGVRFPEMGWIAWVALVPLILAVREASPRRAFVITFLSAAVWYGGSLFWLYRAMNTFGHLPAVTSFLLLVLVIIMAAVYAALSPMFARAMERRFGGEFIVWLSASWVAVEILRNYLPFNGFPWSNIAVSQWKFLPVIQLADLTGIYGVTFLIVWVNVFIAESIIKYSGRKANFFIPKAVTTAVMIAAVLAYGVYKLRSFPGTLDGTTSLSVGLIQGNIPQEEKWDPSSAVRDLNAYREQAQKLAESSVEMIIWPEASFPWSLRTTDTEIDPRALGLTKDGLGETPHTIFGAISERPDDNYYNSAILFDASGKIVGRYYKAHLVPFGEYVPHKKLLFFARKLTEPVGNFLAGDSYEPLSTARAKVGILICYEDIFPEIARKTVKEGAEFLANLTNDAWYGVSSAPYQHLAISVFRAVENRRFLVRSTNTGVSAVVMPTGKVLIESGIFEPAVIVSPIALLDRLSPYTRLGDWFAWACLAYVVFGVGMAVFPKIKKASNANH